jgi:subtilase family serine protease
MQLKHRLFVFVAATLGVVSAPHVAGAKPLVAGPAIASDIVRIAVHLPLQNSAELDTLVANQASKASPLYHHFLSPAQFRARYSASSSAIGRAQAALRLIGFTIERTSSQLIVARAAADVAAHAFAIRPFRVRNGNAIHVGSTTPLTLPSELALLHATVAGLSASEAPRPGSSRALTPANRFSNIGPYFADDLKQAYNFPAYQTLNGRDVSVAIIGASDFSDSDLRAYLRHERIGAFSGALAPAPRVKHVILDGSLPFDPASNDSFEANLDTQQLALTAPGATITAIAAPNFDISSFLAAYEFVDETNAYDIVESSYGGCELFYTAAYNNGIDLTGIAQAYHDLFRQGNAQGTTFVEITQDQAGLICPESAYFDNPPTTPARSYKYIPSVAFWGDDPAVTAVGGGNLLTSARAASLRSTYVSENGFSDRLVPEDPYLTGNLLDNGRWGGGSGVSVLFSKPAYQKLVQTDAARRAVPDVSFHVGGCPIDVLGGFCPVNRSSDYEVLGGEAFEAIGASAAAPDFAGLLSLKVQSQNSRLGNENFDLYELGRANTFFPYHFFRQGQPGNNGVVKSAAGWQGYNRIYGLGTPLGANFDFVPFSPLAGDPQTASNP